MSAFSFASSLSALRSFAAALSGAWLAPASVVSAGSRLFCFSVGSTAAVGGFVRRARSLGFCVAVGRCPFSGVWLVGVGPSVSSALSAVRGLRGCSAVSRLPSVVRVWSPVFSGFLGYVVGLGRARSF